MKKIKVVVGMSGGVDSAVSALLLKQSGYEVSGLFMQNWDTVTNLDFLGHKQIRSTCDPAVDFADAAKVADQLEIKLARVEFIKAYWDFVFKSFLDEYALGRTPNPDILCNKFIKFDKFIDYAFKTFNCDYIAMGHYAQIVENNGEFFLKEVVDKNKDQTYFLCGLNQRQLSKVIFPIGTLTKTKVRKIANDNHLYVADKKDSTGICFIGERKFSDFLKNYLPNQPGKIIDYVSKKVLGTHLGVMYYTIGQNRNLNLGGNRCKYYVYKKDVKHQIIYVVDENHRDEYLFSTQCVVENFNWINANHDFDQVEVRFRHRQAKIKATFEIKDHLVVINYQPTFAVTPGQYAVLYHDGFCLGGGPVLSIN